MTRGRRILLTGGRGFLGASIARRLVAENDVVVLDVPQRPAPLFEPLRDHPRLTFVEGDVLDAECVRGAARGAQVVFHLAAVAGVQNYHARPARTLEVNLVGTWHVLRAALAASCERFVQFSTSEVYGPEAEGAREDAPTPIGPVAERRWSYAASKIAAEHLAHAFGHERGLPVVSLRPFNVYGPGQVGEGAVHAFVVAALLGHDLAVTGDGAQTRAWCYVDDLVEAALSAAERPEAVGQCLNVGNPTAVTSIRELAERVLRIAGSRSRIVATRHVGADVLRRSPVVDRARALLGFEPTVGLDEGLGRTVEWYRALDRSVLEAYAEHLRAGAPHAEDTRS